MQPGTLAIAGVLHDKRTYQKQDKSTGYVLTIAWMGGNWSSFSPEVYQEVESKKIELGDEVILVGKPEMGDKGSLKFQQGTLTVQPQKK